MGRKKRLAENAEPTTIYLTPVEKLVLGVIEMRRGDRKEARDSPSEIIVDALWHWLTEVEKMPKEQIEALRPKTTEQSGNIKPFPKKS